MTTSSNEAKTPLANDSSPKDSSESADLSALLLTVGDLQIDSNYSGHHQNGFEMAKTRVQDHIRKLINAQLGASASAPTTTVTDHSPASEPESSSSIQSVVDEIRERLERAMDSPLQMTSSELRSALCDVSTLLSIIDSQTATLEMYRKQVDLDFCDRLVAETASNMKAELIKRVREKAMEFNEGWVRKAVNDFATELEAVELGDNQ